MANFKPQFTIPRQNLPYYDKKRSDTFIFPTYAELKRKLAGIMKEHDVTEVCVSRSRRGEWGEWFEYWHLTSDGKLFKGRQGWM